jgi:uncharacterized protein (TIGR02147 family)
MSKILNLFDYSDYREFVKNWLSEAKKAKTANLSDLAQCAQVHTTFMSQVLSGLKNLSLEQALAIAGKIGLSKLERNYFFCLIQLDRAGTPALREYWQDQKKIIETEKNKMSSRVGEHHELSDQERAIFYSSWIYVAIFVATSLNNGQSLSEISDYFQISREKTEEILNFLVKTGVCYFEDGFYKMGKTIIHVPDESPFVVKHHMNWRLKAMQKMDTRSKQDIFFTSPMSLSKADRKKVREIFAHAIQRTLEICKDSPAEEVICLNIDFFSGSD